MFILFGDIEALLKFFNFSSFLIENRKIFVSSFIKNLEYSKNIQLNQIF
jgi:hypothetical protein